MDGSVRGLFYGDPSQLVAQIIGCATLVGIVFTISYLGNCLIDGLVGQRVGAASELEGLDLPEMGALGYPEFQGDYPLLDTTDDSWHYSFMTFTELLAKFPTEESCKAYLVSKRWQDGAIRCPRCDSAKVFHLARRPYHWVCKSGIETVNTQTGEVVTCHKRNGYRFSVISGTIFENTNYKLRVWFQVMFLMGHSKKGMSALQIKRTIFHDKASYETVWYMCTRIRAAMKDDEFFQLMGQVEVDETRVGGKNKNRHWNKKTKGGGPIGKTPVIGAISRKGNIICKVIEDTSTETLSRFVRQAVSDKVDLIVTDEGAGYRKLDQAFPHDTVDHKSHEYVRGNVHTNNIESFWSLLKRGIMGSYHKVSKEYLPLYVAEFTFRHNHRKDKDIFGSIVAGC